ncbi:hypothetical protein IHE45_20G060300 [Dioscorea alata]|uniref:Uncharacterized protein n=1 Tax=Dioscorea alata TaxID=55571 RepID=A0ACB7TUL7_DIOAL|nr:hypothetical protein IHE45_20G060300 [Dioscorea alata]
MSRRLPLSLCKPSAGNSNPQSSPSPMSSLAVKSLSSKAGFQYNNHSPTCETKTWLTKNQSDHWEITGVVALSKCHSRLKHAVLFDE